MTGDVRRAALLIRWQDHGLESRWQAVVENAYTGEQRRFIDKSDLMHFLWQWVYGDALPPHDADVTEDSNAIDGVRGDTA